MSKPAESTAKPVPTGIKFLLGGMAGMGGTLVVQPFDVIKTRMQMGGTVKGGEEFRNSLDCAMKIVGKDGPRGLYKGIGAGLLRQATYTTARVGVYTNLNTYYIETYQSKPTVLASMVMGICAGAAGAFVGTPSDVVLIRMASDGRLPLAERRNYKNVVNALVRIAREEGLPGLWVGCVPTIARAVVINVGQLASYSQIKNYFREGPLKMEEGLKVQIVSSMVSAVITTLISMPLDIVKTRIQNMRTIDGKPEFKGSMDVVGRVVRNEGVLALWKGITPYFLRLGPHTVCVLVFLEQLTIAYRWLVMGESNSKGGSSM